MPGVATVGGLREGSVPPLLVPRVASAERRPGRPPRESQALSRLTFRTTPRVRQEDRVYGLYGLGLTSPLRRRMYSCTPSSTNFRQICGERSGLGDATVEV